MFGVQSRGKNSKDYVNEEDEGVEKDVQTILAEKIDLLTEKRHTVREAALLALSNTVSSGWVGEELNDRVETLTEVLRKNLPRADETEAVLSCRVISLLALSLPLVSSRSTLLLSLKDVLSLIIQDEAHTRPIAARQSAVRALSTLTLMGIDGVEGASAESDSGGTSEEECLLSVLQVYQELFYDEESRPLWTDTLAAWSLLVTVASEELIRRTLYPLNVDRFIELLEDGDVEVRILAGRAVSCMVEALRDALQRGRQSFEGVTLEEIDQVIDEEIQGRKDSEEDEERSDVGGVGSVYDVIQLLQETLDDPSRFKSKTEKKRQKTSIRNDIAFLENNESSDVSFIIRGQQLLLPEYHEVVQMEHVRSIFGEGFLAQLEGNPNLMMMFDYDAPSAQSGGSVRKHRMTKQEKRRYMGAGSAAAKSQSRLRSSATHQRAQLHVGEGGDY
eukprot:TRINITY_DN12014_c0_g1_i2.p1 TRINITY_DN12014_c0_g1~~TRINITY_DN12014_c0_g1_i2.p1  ORF type:complete len:446 (-),score=118.56 TRINITY_DN12014_c0_g1_i2:205-1542(-)